MNNRLINITQTLIVLLIISLIYQFDKVKSASSKSQLDAIRLLDKFSDISSNSMNSSKTDEAIRKWLVNNDEATYELNLKARETVSQALNDVGVDTTEISQAKDLGPIRGGGGFITSRIAFGNSNYDSNYESGDVGKALEGYRAFTQKRPVSVLTGIDIKEIEKKLSAFKPPVQQVQNDDPFGDLLVNETEEFNFKGCYLKKDALVISYQKPQRQNFQETLQKSRVTIPAETVEVTELSYYDLLPTSDLRLLSNTEVKALEKYADQSLDEVEGVLVGEYLHAFGKVEVLGFQLSNQSFSTVIILLLFIVAGVLLLTLNQLKGKTLDTSDSDNVFSIFIEIGWLRKLTWILLPLIINGIALYHSYDLDIYWFILCTCAVLSIIFMLRSTSKVDAISK